MPFEIEAKPDLIIATFTGSVTNEDLIAIGRAAADVEDRYERLPNRLTDLSQCDGLMISFNGILGVAEARRSRVFGNPFKSALVVANDAQRGFARMFQTLMDHPQVTVQIFGSFEAATAWLLE